MGTVINGHDFTTLLDRIHVNGRKVEEIWVNGQQVYPDDRTTYTYLKTGLDLRSIFYDLANHSHRFRRLVRASEIPAGVTTRTISLSTSRIPAYCYALLDEGTTYYTIYLYSEATYFKANPNMREFLVNESYCYDFPVLADFDTSDVTDLYEAFFGIGTESTDWSYISNWDVSKVTNFKYIFKESGVRSIQFLQNWDTSSVINMEGAFHGCTRLTALTGLGNWNLHNVKNMANMFNSCYVLSNIAAMALWDTSSVTDMSYLFYRCRSIGDYTALVSWNTANVTNFSYTFASDMYNTSEPSNVSLYPLRNWNVGHATDMSYMFAYHNRFDTLHGLENWNISNVTDMSCMFKTTSSAPYGWYPTLQNVDELSLWDTSSVVNMESFFEGQVELNDISGLRNWNVSRVISLAHFFYDCKKLFDTTPLFLWNTVSVTNMNATFYQVGYSNRNNPVDFDGLKYWNVSNVTTMYGTFMWTHFQTLTSLSNWNVGKVSDMTNMFFSAWIGSLNALSYWDVHSVNTFSSMFSSSTIVLEGLDNWNTSSATSMYSMFSGCYGTMSTDCLRNWNVSKVTTLNHMFSRSPISSFSSLQNWNTSKVEDMDYFASETQIVYLDGLENWNVSRVSSYWSCFSSCRNLIDGRAITPWLISRSARFNYMFDNTPACTTTHMLPEWNGTWSSRGTFTPA